MARKKQVVPTENELLALIMPTPRPAGWKTINELSAESGQSKQTVASKLDTLVEQGRAERQYVTVGGRRVRIYRVKKRTPKS